MLKPNSCCCFYSSTSTNLKLFTSRPLSGFNSGGFYTTGRKYNVWYHQNYPNTAFGSYKILPLQCPWELIIIFKNIANARNCLKVKHFKLSPRQGWWRGFWLIANLASPTRELSLLILEWNSVTQAENPSEKKIIFRTDILSSIFFNP